MFHVTFDLDQQTHLLIRLYVKQYRLIQTLCGGTGIMDVSDVMDVTDITDVMDVADIKDVRDIADIAGVTDVTDITGGTVRHMASY